MSGIFGIISKNNQTLAFGENQRNIILSSLSTDAKDPKTLEGDSYWAAVGSSNNVSDFYQHSFAKNLNLHCFIEGYVSLTNSEKESLKREFETGEIVHDIDFLPFLFKKYKIGVSNFLTGFYNILFIDLDEFQFFLLNDRLGFLPLYMYENDTILLFASKIEAILATGLIPKIEFDYTTIAEQITFNYPLSNNTSIKGVNCFQAATSIFIERGKIHKKTYWSPSELIVSRPLDYKSGLEVIYESLRSGIVQVCNRGERLAVSFTGGWDGRLVLSYALKNSAFPVKAFSFGTSTSPDILIPRQISNCEGFIYTPFILEQNYFDNHFLESSVASIINSNGLRGYRRAHYHWAIQKISSDRNLILSGNFGDEILKFSSIQPSEVISKQLIDFVTCNFEKKIIFPHERFNEKTFPKKQIEAIEEEWYSRLNSFASGLEGYQTNSEKFNHVKLAVVANRFFGSEVNAYNDFAFNISPFLDFDFIKAISNTRYCSVYHEFNANKTEDKRISAQLYARLVTMNSPKLASYETDRGYSMTDVLNPLGNVKIFINRLKRKSKVSNQYFLENAEDKFVENLLKEASSDCFFVSDLNEPNANIRSRIQSINYWINYITNKYR